MATLSNNKQESEKRAFNSVFIFFITLGFSGLLFASCESVQPERTDSNAHASTSPSSSAQASTSSQPTATATSASSDITVDMNDKGIGPVSSVTIPADIKADLADKGKIVFDANCTACHNPTPDKKVGPGLKDVTKRRSPEWIMNMILNPSEMTQKDPIAKELLGKYLAQMANQSLGKEEARAVYEYLRNNDK